MNSGALHSSEIPDWLFYLGQAVSNEVFTKMSISELHTCASSGVTQLPGRVHGHCDHPNMFPGKSYLKQQRKGSGCCHLQLNVTEK